MSVGGGNGDIWVSVGLFFFACALDGGRGFGFENGEVYAGDGGLQNIFGGDYAFYGEVFSLDFSVGADYLAFAGFVIVFRGYRHYK